MKSLINLLPLVVALALLTSCHSARVSTSSNPMVDRDALYAHSWNLSEVNGIPIVTAAGDRSTYLTLIPGNPVRISGYTGCNTFGGTVSYTGTNGLTFYPSVTTKNTCTTSAESSYLNSLRNADSWSVVNDKLVVYDNGKVIARFSPSTYTNDKLYGNWQLASLNDNSVVFEEVYPLSRRPSIMFTPDKTVITGSTGCNTFSCPVTVNSNGIAFADCTATKIACEGSGESIFFRNLNNINGYSLSDDNTLILVTDDNNVMRFVRIK